MKKKKRSLIVDNSLIAEFMGLTFKAYKENWSFNKKFKSYDQCEAWIRGLKTEGYKPEIGWQMGCGKYDTSWDWLIPAVIKFNELNLDTEEYLEWCGEIDEAIISNYDIKQAHSILVKAIKWYNTNKPINPQP